MASWQSSLLVLQPAVMMSASLIPQLPAAWPKGNTLAASCMHAGPATSKLHGLIHAPIQQGIDFKVINVHTVVIYITKRNFEPANNFFLQWRKSEIRSEVVDNGRREMPVGKANSSVHYTLV